MGTFTKPIDLYRAQLARFQQAKLGMREGHRLLAEEGLADARELLSGGLGPKQTSGAFARGASPSLSTPTGRRRALTARQLKNRGIKGSVPLLPINVQSGQLRGSLTLKRRGGFAQQIFDLGQQDPGGGIYTLLPGGTRKMVGRGYHNELQRRWRSRNKAFLDYWRGRYNKP